MHACAVSWSTGASASTNCTVVVARLRTSSSMQVICLDCNAPQIHGLCESLFASPWCNLSCLVHSMRVARTTSGLPWTDRGGSPGRGRLKPGPPPGTGHWPIGIVVTLFRPDLARYARVPGTRARRPATALDRPDGARSPAPSPTHVIGSACRALQGLHVHWCTLCVVESGASYYQSSPRVL